MTTLSPNRVGDPLVGVWRLLEWRAERVDGVVDHPFGADALGQLVYTATGFLSGQMMRADRAPFSTPRAQAVQFDAGDPTELACAFNSFLAYAGRWDRGPDGTVHHRVEICSIPGWAGTTLDREASFDNDKLTLRTPPRVVDRVEQRGVLRWGRSA